jgi:hypothetical protein
LNLQYLLLPLLLNWEVLGVLLEHLPLVLVSLGHHFHQLQGQQQQVVLLGVASGLLLVFAGFLRFALCLLQVKVLGVVLRILFYLRLIFSFLQKVFLPDLK